MPRRPVPGVIRAALGVWSFIDIRLPHIHSSGFCTIGKQARSSRWGTRMLIRNGRRATRRLLGEPHRRGVTTGFFLHFSFAIRSVSVIVATLVKRRTKCSPIFVPGMLRNVEHRRIDPTVRPYRNSHQSSRYVRLPCHFPVQPFGLGHGFRPISAPGGLRSFCFACGAIRFWFPQSWSPQKSNF